MNPQSPSHPVHHPPSEHVIAELIRAGLSWGTAMSMERWKAQEVLDLLTGEGHAEMIRGISSDTMRRA